MSVETYFSDVASHALEVRRYLELENSVQPILKAVEADSTSLFEDYLTQFQKDSTTVGLYAMLETLKNNGAPYNERVARSALTYITCNLLLDSQYPDTQPPEIFDTRTVAGVKILDNVRCRVFVHGSSSNVSSYTERNVEINIVEESMVMGALRDWKEPHINNYVTNDEDDIFFYTPFAVFEGPTINGIPLLPKVEYVRVGPLIDNKSGEPLAQFIPAE